MRNAWILPLLLACGLWLHFGAERLRGSGVLRPERGARAPRAPRRAPRPGHVGPVTLKGPGGKTIELPLAEPAVVNVWLQGCADCMPRFRASQQLALEGAEWPRPVINVAYGRADPSWAEEYGVSANLVIDPGTELVGPLGISTFTTLVIDAEGRVVHRDFAERPGFLARVAEAMQTARAARPKPADTTAPTPEETPPPEPAPQPQAELTPISRDPRVVGGLALLVLAALLKVAGGAAAAQRDDPLWRDELVAGGRRCHECGGRFYDPEEIGRCETCRTPFHEKCRGDVCTNMACARYMKAM